MDTITLTINGQKLTTTRGKTVLDAARAAGIHIPTLCAHEDLPNYGACRLCVVEIEGVRGYPTSCTTPAIEGMVVRTQTPELQELRDSVMELMLSGHPSGCLSCDHREDCEKYKPEPAKAGRTTKCGACSNRSGCSVREMVLPAATHRLDLPTLYNSYNLERDDPFIDRDHNLCVLCGRCWRICEQIHGTPAISIINRGRHARIGTAFGKSWVDSGCTFCGACVDICPTGTLTDRFARWFGKSEINVDSCCTLCPEGCSLRESLSEGHLVETRMTSFRRDARLCALGRFALPQLLQDSRRLGRPLIRQNGEQVPADWPEALATAAEALAAYKDGSFVAIVGESHTREARFLCERLACEIMGGRLASVPAGGSFDDLQPAAVRSDILAGKVKAALVTGDYLSPEALQRIECLIVADFLPSPASERATVVLPLAVLAEDEGTFRTAADQVKHLGPPIVPTNASRVEWAVVRDLSRALGADGAAFDSLGAVTAAIGGDAAPAPFVTQPRDRLVDLPQRYRGHLLADSAPGLKAMGLPGAAAPAPVSSDGGFLVVEKQEVVPNFHRIVLRAPAIAHHAQAGQFVIVMVNETSERMPLTLVDWDAAAETITLIVEEVGRSSREIVELRAGDRVAHVTGPLGVPFPVENYGTVVLGGGCFGVGGIYPLARALKAAGNHVIGVIEACSNYLFYMEETLRKVCDQVLVATKDGSRGTKGGVQEVFVKLHQSEPKIDLFVALGCTFMMRMSAQVTRPLNVRLLVGLNPIMIDGTGMCGACRCAVGGQTKFACVDGPFFDGHAVNWDELLSRRRSFVRSEVEAMPQHVHPHGGVPLPQLEPTQESKDW